MKHAVKPAIQMWLQHKETGASLAGLDRLQESERLDILQRLGPHNKIEFVSAWWKSFLETFLVQLDRNATKIN